MNRSLHVFLLRVLLYALPVIIGYEIAYRSGLYPVITVSELFDYKIRQARKAPADPRIISIGSSQTLFGLNSETMADSLDPAYHNFGSWGLQISDTWVTLPALLEEWHAEEIIMCASVWDFVAAANPTYSAYVRSPSFIRHFFPEYFYIKNYRSLHFLYQRRFSHRPVVDRWGGGTIGALQDRFVPDAHTLSFPTASTAGNYRALDSISSFLQQRGIRLIFVQMPIESRYFAIDSLKEKSATFFSTCKQLVEKHGGIYLNYCDAHLPDSLFLDMAHVNSLGAIVLTKMLASDLKQMKK